MRLSYYGESGRITVVNTIAKPRKMRATGSRQIRNYALPARRELLGMLIAFCERFGNTEYGTRTDLALGSSRTSNRASILPPWLVEAKWA